MEAHAILLLAISAGRMSRQYTQADILASTDLTGSEALGGDWDLEYAAGNIEAELAFNAEINQDYQSVLNDFFTGDIPIFDNGTVFRDFPTDVTLPGSNFPSAPARLQLNRVIDSPNIDLTPPNLFDPSIIGNADFRIDYTPVDLRFIESQFNPDRSLVNFSQAENQPFSLNFANGNFSFLENAPNYNYDQPKINSLVFPFDANSLNFNPSNFEFTSVSFNEFNTFNAGDDSITFKFNAGTFDFSSLTSRNSLPFQFTSNVTEFYEIEYNNIVRFGAGCLTQVP